MWTSSQWHEQEVTYSHICDDFWGQARSAAHTTSLTSLRTLSGSNQKLVLVDSRRLSESWPRCWAHGWGSTVWESPVIMWTILSVILFVPEHHFVAQVLCKLMPRQKWHCWMSDLLSGEPLIIGLSQPLAVSFLLSHPLGLLYSWLLRPPSIAPSQSFSRSGTAEKAVLGEPWAR